MRALLAVLSRAQSALAAALGAWIGVWLQLWSADPSLRWANAGMAALFGFLLAEIAALIARGWWNEK